MHNVCSPGISDEDYEGREEEQKFEFHVSDENNG